jgi:tripartite-type tricarboxylate transporter receptor subunit TctC
MAKEPAGLYPQVPTLKAATGSDWTIGAWRGIATPKGFPAEAQTKLAAAIKKIYDSKEYKDFMTQRGFGLIYADAKGFGDFMAKGDADMGVVMKSLGLAK